ncbi:MAG: ATP-binding protein [Gammaproteobacteria bacterium]|nr:ATP-binding protein [Gammaproteobacteria bacterium]
MPTKLIHSLKFQITAVLVLLLSLFSFAITYTLYTIDEREKETAALQLINRLQLITNYMEMQSFNYLKHAPQSSSAYERDIGLYYKELKGQLNNKNDIITCFADEHLRSDLVGMDEDINLNLDTKTKETLISLQKTWDIYFKELKQTLGESENSPKLAAAAQYIAENQKNIKEIEAIVVKQLQQDISDRINWINHVNKLILATAFLVALFTLGGFYIKVITPLNKAVEGFNKVARGDFGHQVIVSTDNEIASIAKSFNHLSQRLYSIFQLIDRVQQGNDLDNTLGFIAEQFSSILPINWTSVLLHNGNATMLELQKTYMDSKPHALPRTLFSVEGTLLEKAIQSDKPLFISNLDKVAEKNKNYVFLGLLAKEGMKSAIFLHLTQATQVPGMLVFASRKPNAYNEEHIELLNNIAHLVTHSFGKTVKMAEQRRLAAIGEFTSGIVHEVRNPLTSIGLALKYFSRLELDEDGTEWAEIAGRESERMGRLLEDVLLYAKPVKLDLVAINLLDFINEFIKTNKTMGEEKQLLLEPPIIGNSLTNHALQNNTSPQKKSALQINNVRKNKFTVNADKDRLNQIFLNIYRNATEAADSHSTIRCLLQNNHAAHTSTIEINNQGEVIPDKVLQRIGEPFFTTKSRGTGLGMGIVKRMLEAHSGNLEIVSTKEQGTSVFITIPYIGIG